MATTAQKKKAETATSWLSYTLVFTILLAVAYGAFATYWNNNADQQARATQEFNAFEPAGGRSFESSYDTNKQGFPNNGSPSVASPRNDAQNAQQFPQSSSGIKAQ